MTKDAMEQPGLFPDTKTKTAKSRKPKSQQMEMFGAEVCAPVKGHYAPEWRGKLVLESEDPRTEEEKLEDEMQKAKSKTRNIHS